LPPNLGVGGVFLPFSFWNRITCPPGVRYTALKRFTCRARSAAAAAEAASAGLSGGVAVVTAVGRLASKRARSACRSATLAATRALTSAWNSALDSFLALLGDGAGGVEALGEALEPLALAGLLAAPLGSRTALAGLWAPSLLLPMEVLRLLPPLFGLLAAWAQRPRGLPGSGSAAAAAVVTGAGNDEVRSSPFPPVRVAVAAAAAAAAALAAAEGDGLDDGLT